MKKPFVKTGALSPQQLNTLLAMGSPIVIGVQWHDSNMWHVLTIGSCENGKYQVHNPNDHHRGHGNHNPECPVDATNDWKEMTYSEILNMYNDRGKWFITYYMHDAADQNGEDHNAGGDGKMIASVNKTIDNAKSLVKKIFN